jgi:hypothetical protein
MCLDVIGEGPFGTVYEGRYRGSTVAVKKMKMTAQPMKPSMRENMEMELQVEAGRMGTYVYILVKRLVRGSIHSHARKLDAFWTEKVTCA